MPDADFLGAVGGRVKWAVPGYHTGKDASAPVCVVDDVCDGWMGPLL